MKKHGKAMQNSKKTPSLYIYLVEGILGLLIIVILLTLILLNSLSYIRENSYNKIRVDKIIAQESLLKSENYDEIKYKNYIGKRGYIEIIDDSGKLYYSSNPENKNTYDEYSAKYIENVDQSVTYSVMHFQKSETDGTTNDGFLVIRYENPTDAQEDVDAEDGETKIGVAIIDENYQIQYTNMNFNGDTISEKEISYLLGTEENLNYQDGVILQKYAFTTNSGEQRYLLLHYEGPYFGTEHKIERLNIMVVFIYIALVILTVFIIVFRMTSRIRKPMKQLERAMDNFSEGSREQITLLKSPREFTQVADTFNNMEAQLKASEESRSRMLADISHDLKTPITVIQGYVDAMRDGLVPEVEHQKYLDIISKKTTILVELINSFSDFSRLEHPNFEYHMEEDDICEYIREYVASKYQELTVAGYEVEVEIPEDVLKIPFDHLQLKRVFENIISNAVRYTEPGTTLYFEVFYDKELHILIGDNGPGIADELKEHIFDPFVVAEAARNNGQGTGLGLSIAKSIVEGHGGTIGFADAKQKTKGTFYEICLPLYTKD